MAGGDGTFLCGACVCFVLIPSVILIVLSFATLQPVEYGLNFNAITMSLENATYSQAGLYFLGFGHWFIRYPRTIQTIEFMATGENQLLHTRTADGLPLTLGLSFQYRYMPEHLNKLYLTYKNEHHAVYVNTATAAIANVVRARHRHTPSCPCALWSLPCHRTDSDMRNIQSTYKALQLHCTRTLSGGGGCVGVRCGRREVYRL
jgi:hypothetical protein